MNSMVLHNRVGLFHLDIAGFQAECLPFPKKVLEGVTRYLPVIAAKRNDALLNVIKVMIHSPFDLIRFQIFRFPYASV